MGVIYMEKSFVMKVNINEGMVSGIVRDVLMEYVGDGDNGGGIRLYTQLTRLDKGYVDEVFSEGLKCKSGEEADGIWFSLGRRFYGDVRGFCFSVPYSREMMEVGGFDRYDWENHSDVLVAYRDIPFKYLKLEEGPLCAWRYKCGDGSGKWRYSFMDCSVRGERMFSGDRIRRFDKNKEFVIFRDIWYYLFGREVDESGYDGIGNVRFDEFLHNGRWRL